jgi:alpha-tubulin suppressor-like RCC1 family protein
VKTAFNSRRHHLWIRVGVLLIAVTLVVGMVGCDGDGYTFFCTLTVASTPGGSVTDPGEGTFTYNSSTEVNLTALPDDGYYFVNWTGDVGSVGDVNAAGTTIWMADNYSITANFAFGPPYTAMLAAGAGVPYVIGLRPNGTVCVAGEIMEEEWGVSGWKNITQVAAGDFEAVGLKTDGTVVTAGGAYWQSFVAGWSDITQVAAGYYFALGVKSGGTAVASGPYYPPDVSNWTDIIQVAAGFYDAFGLRSDGSVLTSFGGVDVGNWTDIVQIAACDDWPVGLKSDGTVVATGDWQSYVAGWSNITQIDACGGLIVGLKSDGTVVAVGSNSWGQCNVSSWTDIVQVAAGGSSTFGLKSDGTVVAVGLAKNYLWPLDRWLLR